MNDLIESIKLHEGFESKPYPDPLHGWDVPTFGHGLTYITESESEQIVVNRVNEIIAKIQTAKPVFKTLTTQRKHALIEMAYQMGVGGLFKFRKMWTAIEAGDFDEAYTQALDSRWAKQTPNRAQEVASLLR
jgi:lysozyme